MAGEGLRARIAGILERAKVDACIQCGRCTATCPAALPSSLRAREVVRAPHTAALAEISRTGNIFPLEVEIRAVRGQLSLPLDPPDCAHDPEELAAFHRLLEVLAFQDLAPERRPYVGEDAGEDTDEGSEGGEGQ